MIFNWFNLFNLDDFLATGLVSRNLKVALQGVGDAEILITNGNLVSLTYLDVFMPIQWEGDNPFTRQGDAATYGVWLDVNRDVWLAIEVPE